MKERLFENAAYLTLALTIAGQIISTGSVLSAQLVWLVANVITVARDYALKRPNSDKVRDWALCGITGGLVVILTVF